MFRRKPLRKRNVLLEDALLLTVFWPILTPITLSLATLALVGHYMYRYFEATDFTAKTALDEAKKNIAVTMDLMIEPSSSCGLNPLDQLNDETNYTIYFASRPGFQDTFDFLNKMKSPVTHASIAIKNPDGYYLIIGRQSPSCSLDPKLNWKEKIKLFGRLSIPCNEKPYMFSTAQINQNNGVTFTGKEIKAAINATTKEICNRGFNFVESNCYSFTITILCKLVITLDKREFHDNLTVKAFESLSDELLATKHHFGLGVINNKEVHEAVEQAQAIIKRRIPHKDCKR